MCGLHVEYVLGHMTKKLFCSSFQSSSPKELMVPLTTLLVSCYANTGVNDQKSHVAPHFDHLELRNAMVPLMMTAMALHDHKNFVALHFSCLNLRNRMNH